mmetsp:Transcript_61819/g.182506  ORF Transcript_61819/g.182506 Transcript_61819/m.182506 type:complete len:212 (+) Transcript_61819:332-967(+)
MSLFRLPPPVIKDIARRPALAFLAASTNSKFRGLPERYTQSQCSPRRGPERSPNDGAEARLDAPGRRFQSLPPSPIDGHACREEARRVLRNGRDRNRGLLLFRGPDPGGWRGTNRLAAPLHRHVRHGDGRKLYEDAERRAVPPSAALPLVVGCGGRVEVIDAPVVTGKHVHPPRIEAGEKSTDVLGLRPPGEAVQPYRVGTPPAREREAAH